MSIYADDVVSFTSVLKIAYNFITARDYLLKKKSKEKKKLISVALGLPDLVFAADSIPVFPIRLEKFKLNLYLIALNTAKSLFGWDLTTNLLGIARQLDFLKIVDSIINDVISTINIKYNTMFELGIKTSKSPELCYGVHSIYGMHKSQHENLDANLNFTIRCNECNSYSRTLKSMIPDQIWVDIPSLSEENNLDHMKHNLQETIVELEHLTGNVVTDNSLKKQFRIGNQVKRYYKTILHEISASEFYPCNPATFAEILGLLTISFQDYNSNAQRYLENMSQLVKEMRERIKKGIGMDVSNTPRLLISPIFNGWEPEIHEIIYKFGGRAIYADWDILGLLDEIPVSKNSDPIEDYARFLLNASNKGIQCLKNCDSLANSYSGYTKKWGFDGIIFNQVLDCHSNYSNCYELLKNKMRNELRKPSVIVRFKKIGDNVEEVKNKLTPFMDLFA
ncbi:MAG: 2-hydroxyacyl-CoA dehydratase family protein [Promethearchaeota archaeon]|jgi:benzoyl-CoA reductase/2-hydroxyglutaryl-CoA dehydratase subunit BcrC/BadD/HgdB